MSKESDSEFPVGSSADFVRARLAASKEGGSKTVQDPHRTYHPSTILKRYESTGQLPKMSEPQFFDVTEIPKFEEAANIMVKAREAFESLPFDVRQRFGNDPRAFLFAHDAAVERKRAADLAEASKETVNDDSNDDQVSSSAGGLKSSARRSGARRVDPDPVSDPE